jgi:glutaredoxin 3
MAKVKIYTTSVCPYCASAKKLFQSLNQAYEEISLDGKEELRASLSTQHGGWKTVPMIFVDEKFIGGFDDTVKLKNSGELARLLAQ